ncbi:MAG: TetR/AcrR family transcriptional regulator [Myxococcales bacterium]|nr:TetR/AcrR family transcriptional regulator [Myxococcales bacterium]
MRTATASPSPDTSAAGGVRDQILDAASAEFAERGLGGASVRKIAARAGTTAAMINYYFGGKQALYDEVVARAQSELLMAITLALGEPGGEDELAPRLAGAYFDFLCDERDLPRLLLREVLDRGEALQGLAQRYLAPLRQLFEEHFGDSDAAFDGAVSIFGAVAAYFTYAPLLATLRDEDPLGAEALARRRAHVMALAALVGEQLG